MTIAQCIGEPVSWLRLERHHLGESSPAERARVIQHLAVCTACSACLASIEASDASALAPLALSPERRAGATRMRARRRMAAAGVGALALAAAAVLAVGRGWRMDGGDGIVDRVGASRVKGDVFAFSLVRDDDERIVEAGGVFRDGDRFKALVTCPPAMNLAFDLVVFDSSGVASFPLDPIEGVWCGNDVPLPGAFRLRGAADETVCIAWNEGAAVDRSRVSKGEAFLGDGGLCKHLSPSTPEGR
jgi:hypothetical protein